MIVFTLLACQLSAKDPIGKDGGPGDSAGDDEGCAAPSIWYADADSDGLGTPDYTTTACEQPDGYADNADDCDDADAAVAAGGPWYADADGDTFGAGAAATGCVAPEGAISDNTDCDDTNPASHPGADEHCDTRDEDCDNVADDDPVDGIAVYVDADLDGFGDPNAPTTACSVTAGFVANDADCDDTTSAVAPGAEEHCDGVDEDCDTILDNNPVDALSWYNDSDGDGYGDTTETRAACEQPTDFVADNSDCDDGTSSINPAASEICGGGDENCDGAVDEDTASDAALWYADADGDGYGTGTARASCDKPADMVGDSGDCDDGDDTVSPAGVEACGGGDEDCDGTVDEASALGSVSWYTDADGDGYGDGAAALACTAPAGSVAADGDCDDADDTISPGEIERCDDGIDDDCDGDIDDGCWTLGALTMASANATLTGVDAADNAGLMVVGGADVTGDGLDDLVVGAAESDGRGAIYVSSGPISSGSLSAARRIAGNAATERADYRFSVADDTDADGVNDLIARDYGVGRARLILGPLDGSVSLATADKTWTGSASKWGDTTLADLNDDGAGDAIISWSPSTCIDYGPLSGVCDATVNTPGSDAIAFSLHARDDLDGDGIMDLVLGDYYGTSMYVFTTAAAGTVTAGTADVMLTGSDSPGIGIGTGDFDGDGTADLAASASYDADGGSGAGAVYVVSGGATFGSGVLASVSASKLTGAAAGDQAGTSVAVGDLDADGLADLAIGGYGDGDWLVFGPVPAGTTSLSAADNSFSGATGFDAYSVGFGGDLLGTGQETLLLGSYDADDAAIDAGAVYVFGGGGR